MPILVVDDEPFFRATVSTILRKAGFHTIEAQNGLEAYEIVRANGASIELLLTDFKMPRMDGLSLIEAVRETHPKMPVLLMTGSRLENRPSSYTVLNKLIGREALLQAVRSAIAAARLERPSRKVEVFTSRGCCCEELITAIRAAACPFCEISVVDLTAAEGAERANRLGVQSFPAVAINDELVCCPCECGPDLTRLRAAGLGVPLPKV
jgi:CheY-like chemotaxis protein